MAATAAMTFSLQSCEWFKTGRGGAGDSLDVQPYCTVSFHDSVTVVESTAYQEMHIDFPAEEDTSAVSQAVLSWLCEKVRSCCFPDYVGDSAVAVYTPDPVNATFAEDYVDTYARKGLERMAAEMRKCIREAHMAGSPRKAPLSSSVTDASSDGISSTRRSVLNSSN